MLKNTKSRDSQLFRGKTHDYNYSNKLIESLLNLLIRFVRISGLSRNGPLAKMNAQRLPTQLPFGQLSTGTRCTGAPKKRFKDIL